jgi:hypothetical protein
MSENLDGKKSQPVGANPNEPERSDFDKKATGFNRESAAETGKCWV